MKLSVLALVGLLGSTAAQCPDPTGCDICPNGAIADDSKVVTIDSPADGNPSTDNCAEWFATVCLAAPGGCEAWQEALVECCGGSTAGDEAAGDEAAADSLNAACLECIEAPGADPADCTEPCQASTVGSTSKNAACFECLEAPGADPGDCTTQCDTSVAADGNPASAECFECLEAPGADPGDCDTQCDSASDSSPTMSSPTMSSPTMSPPTAPTTSSSAIAGIGAAAGAATVGFALIVA